jgi:hypothetical protein
LCWIVFAMSCLSAVGADPPLATPAVAPAQPPRATLRTVHRQVSRLPLTRDYRSVPVGDAATVAAHARIDAALVKVADADSTNFIETPLRDVVAQFREWLQVPVVLDHKGLEDAGIDLDAPVTFTGQGTTARAVAGSDARPHATSRAERPARSAAERSAIDSTTMSGR